VTYDPSMVRSLMFLVAAATLPVAGTAAVAVAEPPPTFQMQGSPGPPKCEQNNGVLPAQVFYAPYEPGATYVSTGRGCANTGNPPQPVCTPVGPFAETI
jgi:hypothetical protein